MEKMLSFLPHPSTPQPKSHVCQEFSTDNGGWPRNPLYLTYWWRCYLLGQQIHLFKISFLRLNISFVSQHSNVIQRGDLKRQGSWGEPAWDSINPACYRSLRVNRKWKDMSYLVVADCWLFSLNYLFFTVPASGNRIWRTEAPQRKQKWLN